MESSRNANAAQQQIPGYGLGVPDIPRSPITLDEWEALKKSALFSEEDVVYLRVSKGVLADHVDDLLKTWRGIIFDRPHLRAYDEDPTTHEVDTDYAKAVARRFGQWVLDTARAKYDQAWLDYQYEIGCVTIEPRRTRLMADTRCSTSAHEISSPFVLRSSFR